MKIRLSMITLLIMILCVEIMAMKPAVISLIEKKYNQNSTIQSQFDLTIFWSVREKSEHKTGTMIIAPQNKFRIELNDEVFVSNGDRYWYYNSKTAQVTIENVKKIDVSSLPSNLLQKYLTEYNYSEKEKTGSVVVLEWNKEPNENSVYTSIEIWAEEKTGVIKKIQITDRNSNVNTYTFRRTIFGGKISGKIFDFKVPKNAQVLNNYD